MANLTQPHLGRSACQYRNLCNRGCPYGAYFSSNSSTLPTAERTGNMILRPHSVVHSVIYDEETRKAMGVRVVDAESGDMVEFDSKIIFLNAGCVNTTLIMLNSISDRFPYGLGNDSGELGHNLMDHHHRVGERGTFDGYKDKYYWGRNPNGFYIPRYRNIENDRRDYLRGFGFRDRASREGWWRGIRELAIGKELKEFASTPGKWTMGPGAFGEMLPNHNNLMRLNREKTDRGGSRPWFLIVSSRRMSTKCAKI